MSEETNNKEGRSVWEKIGSGIGTAFSKGGVVIVAIGGIAIVAYLIYSYLQSGLETAKAGYANALKDLIEETKQFLKDNAALNIHGLTEDQQAVIKNVKQPQVDFWERQLQTELAARQYMSNAISNLVLLLGIGVVVAGAGFAVKEILNSKGTLFKEQVQERQKGSGAELEALDSWSQIDFSMQMVAWEFALEGQAGIASGLQDSLNQMYTNMMLPSLLTKSQLLQTELTSLMPGTVMYMAVSNMLMAVNAAITFNTIPAFINPIFMPLPPPII